MERTAKRIINSLIVLSAVALTFSSCERMAMVAGTPVKFNAGISRHGTSETKAVYGSIGATATSQPIEWEKDDLITVYCEQCEDTKVADYVVSEVHPSGLESNSYAKIGNANGNGLIWDDEGTHTFYALFPGVSTTGVTASINGKDITGSIPQSQAFGTVTGMDDKVVPPDMKNMFMTAKSEIEAGEAGEPVFLDFKPLTTVLEFTITNQFDDTKCAMNIKSISLISEGHALSGGFAVDMDQNGLDGRPKTTLASGLEIAKCDSVAIDFGSSPVTLAFGKTLNFTFFLNPGNTVDDLTFEIKGTNVGTSEDFTRRAKLENKDKSKVTFPTHQKTRITGIMVPEDAVVSTITIEGANLSAATIELDDSGCLKLTADTKTDDTISATLSDVAVTDTEGTLSSTSPILIAVPAGAVVSKVSATTDMGTFDFTLASPSVLLANQYSYVKNQTFEDHYNGHAYVEIGDLKWATCNVGASNPKEYGWYFFWGGTEGYEYDSTNNKWVKALDHTTELSGGFCWNKTPYQTASTTRSSSTKFKKYLGSTTSSYKDQSATDENALKNVLDPKDDAAHANWGGKWRMPTAGEFKAMKDATYWAWDATDKGYYVFAPDAGHAAGTRVNSIPSGLSKSNALLSSLLRAMVTMSSSSVRVPAAAVGRVVSIRPIPAARTSWTSAATVSIPSPAAAVAAASPCLPSQINNRLQLSQDHRAKGS